MKGSIEALHKILGHKAPPAIYNAGTTPNRRAEHYDFWVAKTLKTWQDRRTLVGNGQCPVLVQMATGAPLVATWLRGPLVKGNKAIPRGTAIAVFDPDGFYSNNGTYPRHAALYLSQDLKGLWVLDQWAGRDVSSKGFLRQLPFGSRTGHNTVNGGDYFHVVLTAKYTEFDWAAAYGSGA